MRAPSCTRATEIYRRSSRRSRAALLLGIDLVVPDVIPFLDERLEKNVTPR
jgi:hypothetical protein